MLNFLNKKKNKPEIVLNGVLIENPSGRITAYFEEFPDIVAEGDNEGQAKEYLIEALMMVAKFKIKQKIKAQATEVKKHDESGHFTIRHFHQGFGILQAH